MSSEVYSCSMSLRYHGGSCCGSKHIAPFEGYGPKDILAALSVGAASSQYPSNGGTYHLFPGQYSRTYDLPLPEEPAARRLYRILDLCVKVSLAQRIEVTLVDFQLKDWREVLEECGFKLTSEHRNGNTYRTIYTFHLVYDTKATDTSLHPPKDGYLKAYGDKYKVKKDPPKASAKKSAPAPFQAANFVVLDENDFLAI